jgi:hypothetical protein
MRYEERKFVTAAEPAADEAWMSIQVILHAAATSQSQPRELAARYMQLRDTLMKSSYHPQLPGFMLQCLSLDRFRDFIHLYDPRPDARIEFLNRAFRGRGHYLAQPGRDFLSDGEF